MQQTTNPDKELILDAPNTKACEDRFRRVEEALSNGYSLAIAAMSAGIDRDTLRQWLKWGAEGKTPEFAEFLHRCEHARARFEMTRVDIIRKAGEAKDGWTAAAWWLERMIPEVYGKRTVTRHEGQAMPHEWTMEIQGAVDTSELVNREPRQLPAPEREPIDITGTDG
ncbi:MAG: hypothetical protein AMJ65_06830 [Phycisphaerae bacterium SG8_4]|nr:MAG: hypothetical protein AMJ65_06830 [Phycisphaerae bacterium SG8_4]